jgi:hypothetical protein
MKSYKELVKTTINEESVKSKEFADNFGKDSLSNLEKNLSSYVSNLIGVKVDIKVEKDTNRKGDMVFRVTSNDLSGNMKPRMFKMLRVTDFGSSYSEKSGTFWISLHYEYDHIDGGSNGSNICDVWINADGKIVDKQTNF